MCAPDETFEQEFKCTTLCTSNRLLQGATIKIKFAYIYSFILLTVEIVGTENVQPQEQNSEL